MDADQLLILTAPGVAAIAVVRLVGPGVNDFANRHLSKPPIPGRVRHVTFHDDHGVIDDPIVLRDQKSGWLELHLHGGPWVMQAVCDLASVEGFEVIQCGSTPLPLDAVEATDPLEAEMLAWLPAARTPLALRTLTAQPALIRAWVATKPNIGQIDRVLARRSLEHLLMPPTIAIVGEPNAGKSTLANRLFARERSIVADVAGTTRDWVSDQANLDGLAVTLLDTPGLRSTLDRIEAEAIELSRAPIESAQLILLVLDASRPPVEQSYLTDRYPDAVVVLNKVDRAVEGWDGAPAVHCIAHRGDGVEAVRAAVLGRFDVDPGAEPSVTCWTERQRSCLRAARSDPTLLEHFLCAGRP